MDDGNGGPGSVDFADFTAALDDVVAGVVIVDMATLVMTNAEAEVLVGTVVEAEVLV